MITPTPPQPTKRKRSNDEAVLQSRCVSWLWQMHPETRGLYIAIPNENSRSVYENKRMQLVSGAMRKAMGLVAGASDTVLFIPRGCYHAACFEFKTPIGKQSEKQKEWQKKVEDAGYYYTIVRSEEDFKDKMEWYLNL